ncbi:hypothetical protein JHK86_044770 [Glycine max]|nr:hypothetical protein JHK86_044770 [Glycine max]
MADLLIISLQENELLSHNHHKKFMNLNHAKIKIKRVIFEEFESATRLGNHVQPLSSPTHRMVQNLEVVCTACSHCHTSSSDASFKDSRGCSLCWASLSHNLSRRSSRPPSSKPTPPSVYSSRCVIPMARPPATVNTCSSSSPTSIFLLAHMRQPCSTPPHMVPHSGR